MRKENIENSPIYLLNLSDFIQPNEIHNTVSEFCLILTKIGLMIGRSERIIFFFFFGSFSKKLIHTKLDIAPKKVKSIKMADIIF